MTGVKVFIGVYDESLRINKTIKQKWRGNRLFYIPNSTKINTRNLLLIF